jgi:hypothetical protein
VRKLSRETAALFFFFFFFFFFFLFYICFVLLLQPPLLRPFLTPFLFQAPSGFYRYIHLQGCLLCKRWGRRCDGPIIQLSSVPPVVSFFSSCTNERMYFLVKDPFYNGDRMLTENYTDSLLLPFKSENFAKKKTIFQSTVYIYIYMLTRSIPSMLFKVHESVI